MKGLLVKDFLLLKSQKKQLLIMIVFCIFYPAIGMGSFCVQFLGMLALILSISTLSYDEFDNGNCFLFTLPFIRRDYVLEKYILCVAGSCLGPLVGMAIYAFSTRLTSELFTADELLSQGIVSSSVFGSMASIMLPVVFRYGAEKGKLQAYLVIVGLFLLFTVVWKVMPDASKEMLEQNLTTSWLSLGSIVMLVGAVAVSVPISLRIVEKKEF